MTPGAGPVTVVGPGRVGQSVALALAAAGVAVDLRGRRESAPDPVAGRAGISYRAGTGDPGHTLLFAVPDDALASAAREWAGSAGGGRGTAPAGDPAATERPPGVGSPPVALHTSGVHSRDVLAPLAEAGCRTGSWHPLTAVAAPGADAFRGITFGISGDPAAVDRGERLARRVGGRALAVAEGAHARYHAAAVFASNALVACLRAAGGELGEATGGQGGVEDLLPLARAALRNVEERGLEEGLTGPVARGDDGTVARHLEALAPGRRALYRGLARELLRIVEERDAAPAPEALRRLLLPGAGPGEDG